MTRSTQILVPKKQNNSETITFLKVNIHYIGSRIISSLTNSITPI